MPSVKLQPRFHEPRHIESTYSATEAEPGKKTGMVTVNWMLDEIDDPETVMSLNVLEHVLLGTPASPLRKALTDSGLGEGLTGSGLADDLRQPYFTVGLKGIDEGRWRQGRDAGPRYAAQARRRRHRSADRRSVDEFLRVRPAREQHRLVPARHGADVPHHEELAAWRRSVRVADLREAADRPQGTRSPPASRCSSG